MRDNHKKRLVYPIDVEDLDRLEVERDDAALDAVGGDMYHGLMLTTTEVSRALERYRKGHYGHPASHTDLAVSTKTLLSKHFKDQATIEKTGKSITSLTQKLQTLQSENERLEDALARATTLIEKKDGLLTERERTANIKETTLKAKDKQLAETSQALARSTQQLIHFENRFGVLRKRGRLNGLQRLLAWLFRII